MLGLLKRNCSNEYFSVRARRLLYLALVISHINYANEAWYGQSITITIAVERVQRREQILSLVFQVAQYHTKSGFYRQYSINIHSFVKVCPNNFTISRCRTNKHFQQSFFIRSRRLWNLLSKELKLISSTTKFKKQLDCSYKTALALITMLTLCARGMAFNLLQMYTRPRNILR